MIPSRSATTVLHMYAPMLVVDVCTLAVPSALRLSAGRPVLASVIATKDAQVCSAYPRKVARWAALSPELAAPVVAGNAAAAMTSADRIASSEWRRGWRMVETSCDGFWPSIDVSP